MTTEDRYAYWAVIEHHRWWLATDGAHFLEVEASGKLDLLMARRIAREYSVARNIGNVADDGGKAANGLDQLLKAINGSRWPATLVERAEICIELAEDHRERCKRLGAAKRFHAPVSGVTKLMWFLRPTGWTMYDRFARIGLIDRKDDPRLFYKTLSDDGFAERAQAISSEGRKAGLPLHGERIIDMLLLFRGSQTDPDPNGTPFETAKVMNRRHLELLPPERSAALRKLAETVADRLLPDDTFRQRLSPRRTQKAR